MPVDSILVSAAVFSMFLLFAGVLMWGDLHSRPGRQPPRGAKRRSF